jgi:hypothetical protein
VIELTDEIRRAYSEAWFRTLGLDEGDVQQMVVAELRDPSPPRLAAIAAALAIAERQWQEQYGDAFQAGWWRGQHELCPRCGVELDREINPPVPSACTCCGTSWPHAPSSERCTPPAIPPQ